MDSISQVWDFNFREELQKFDNALYQYPIVSMDTEFPGFVRDTPWKAGDLRMYFDVKVNIDLTKIIQLGLTLLDENDNVGGIWEFHFSFCKERDVFRQDSVEFLENSGIDFDKLETDGINAFEFSIEFCHILRKHNRDLLWITFHGLYDLGHTLKLVTRKPLPNNILNFTQQLDDVFGKVVDVKYMARFCNGLRGGELGLQKLATLIGVERIGDAHQAGSDSLLTAMVFAKIKTMYEVEKSLYVGYLYGIHTKIGRLQHSLNCPRQVVPWVRCYTQPKIHCVFVHPPVLQSRLPCVPCPMHPISFYP